LCVYNEKRLWELGFVAGFLKGLIATELGKLIVPGMGDHEKIDHPSQVIGSAVVIIFIVVIVAAVTRMNPVFVAGLVENGIVEFFGVCNTFSGYWGADQAADY